MNSKVINNVILNLMTNNQEHRLSMFIGVKEYQSAYTDIVNQLPNYPENSKIFLDIILQIQNMAGEQKTSKKGYADSKNILREALVVLTADYGRKLSAYASFNNKVVLAHEVKFSESKLRQVSDIAVRDYAQIVHERAEPLLAELVQYGINAETQKTLLEAINTYNSSIGKPAVGKIEGAQVTKKLASLFDIAENALSKMDLAVEIVRLSQPGFYDGYRAARKLSSSGSGSLSVMGFVTDAASGQPLKGVSIWIMLNGEHATDFRTVIKKSAEKGGFNVKSLPEGVYSVLLKKVGYADKTVTMNVSNSEMSVLNINLSKN